MDGPSHPHERQARASRPAERSGDGYSRRDWEVQDERFHLSGASSDGELSNMALAMVLRRMNVEEATPHGFRSSFRDWCGDKTAFPREIAEAALAHAIGDKTEAAYRREDALAKRRKLMDAWAAYCEPSGADEKVTPLRRKA